MALALLGAEKDPTRDAAWARSLPEGAEVVLPAGRYLGPWRFLQRVHLKAAPGAVLVPGDGKDEGHATLTLVKGGDIEGLFVEAPPKGYALRVDRGSATFTDDHLSGSGEAGLYLVASSVRVSNCDFEGNDYGVLTEGPGKLEVSGSRFRKNHRAGIALVSTEGILKDNELVGPFYEAAVTVIHAPTVQLVNNRVSTAGAIGLKFLSSKVTLTAGRISGAHSDAQDLEGNGLYAYHSEVAADGLRIDATHGTGVSVIGGSVTLRRCEILHSSEAAAFVGSGGTLLLPDSVLTDAPVGVFIEPGATADTGSTRFEHIEHARVKGR